jgi:hypothetical protein
MGYLGLHRYVRICFLCWLTKHIDTFTLRQHIIVLTCWCLGLSAPLNLALAQTVASSEVIDQCRTIDPADLETEMQQFTQQFFFEDIRTLNVPRIILTHWNALEVNIVIENEVASARERVQQDAGGLDKLMSAWRPGKAEELAEQVATYAFTSERFQEVLYDLSVAVAADITSGFEEVASSSSSAALTCMQTYIGGSYGQVVASIFGDEIIDQSVDTNLADISAAGTGTGFRGRAAAGLGAVVAGYIARAVIQKVSVQITQRITGNIVGRILGRAGTSAAGAASAAVPVVGWVVGIGLLTWDVIDGSQRGALPQIERALTSDQTQERIRSEIATVIVEDLPALSDEIASDIANEITSEWSRFLEDYDTLLVLARRNRQFATFLDATNEDDLFKLARIVAPMSQRAAVAALNNGVLEAALELPDSAMAIIESGQSLEMTLDWAAAADRHLERVISLEVFNYLAPDDLNASNFNILMNASNSSVRKLVGLGADDLKIVLDKVPAANLEELTQVTNAEQLSTFVWYADRLEQPATDLLTYTWTNEPETIDRFSPRPTRTAIVNAANQRANIRIVARPITPMTRVQDISAFLSGQVSMQTLALKYPNVQWMLIAVGIILLVILLSLLKPVLLMLRTILRPLGWLIGRALSNTPALATSSDHAETSQQRHLQATYTTADDTSETHDNPDVNDSKDDRSLTNNGTPDDNV